MVFGDADLENRTALGHFCLFALSPLGPVAVMMQDHIAECFEPFMVQNFDSRIRDSLLLLVSEVFLSLLRP
ncbi:Conserved hypothetical protein [Prochlorococcus marinus str. MIT 9313]|uniref:Uncharacterized protein n=1 Tax=Prochlorococcus marinus (strain MIT 9313) TaxID=74547 RepID=B9ESS2_PROMM|nr:Conserved hypothetical protein [Prochlorococcus marinus str. MIT 9313]